MGKLIAIEGTDGSGKATQTTRLFERLRNLRVNVLRVSFPNYASESSALIKMYLRGDFGGSAENINPYAAAMFYAVDRFASFTTWKDFYNDGGIVLADRYTFSNMAHQSVNFTRKVDRERFCNWVEDTEFKKFQLPRPDLTIFLEMPPQIAAMLRKERGREDLLESDYNYQVKAFKIYQDLAKKYNWKVVNCAANNFARSSIEIHEDIFRLVEEMLLSN